MTEQQPYTVLDNLPGFELRLYPSHLVAQVTVHSALEDAGGTAFAYLFGYISGENTLGTGQARGGVAPVAGAAGSGGDPAAVARRIPMTAPVLLQPESLAGTYTVGFVLPASLSAATAPDPADPAVSLVAVPEARGAAARFTGRWTAHNYEDHAAALGEAVAAAGLTVRGLPRFALFDPPYKPWFLRRNEVVQTVE
ncbi:heme-binding protein [Arthrobacter sp. ATA002]|uniref:SOUL family heme-binding protein n=1 Tax=Arthrobacter sp. ATA002 TaxID=2991715 RepID=UPI0022A6E893|nr:heme-binding protein [Arthrobacter sp. ATA002]WAP50414.1 heme-binding protein [Arthrobacter sp. ATA002]